MTVVKVFVKQTMSLGDAVASSLVRSPPDPAVGFECWSGTLCCVLRQDTLLSQCLSPPRCIHKWVPLNLMLEGNPTMDLV